MKRMTAALFATALIAVAAPVATAAPKAKGASPTSTSVITITNNENGTTRITSNKDISSYFISCGGVKSEPVELEDGTLELTLDSFRGQVSVKSGTTTMTANGALGPC
jgi:hypothetical protein